MDNTSINQTFAPSVKARNVATENNNELAHTRLTIKQNNYRTAIVLCGVSGVLHGSCSLVWVCL